MSDRWYERYHSLADAWAGYYAADGPDARKAAWEKVSLAKTEIMEYEQRAVRWVEIEESKRRHRP